MRLLQAACAQAETNEQSENNNNRNKLSSIKGEQRLWTGDCSSCTTRRAITGCSIHRRSLARCCLVPFPILLRLWLAEIRGQAQGGRRETFRGTINQHKLRRPPQHAPCRSPKPRSNLLVAVQGSSTGDESTTGVANNSILPLIEP